MAKFTIFSVSITDQTGGWASPPITTAEVGVTRFTMPEADWYAVTTRSLCTWAKSASGAIIGMVSTASPEEEGTRKDSKTSSQ